MQYLNEFLTIIIGAAVLLGVVAVWLIAQHFFMPTLEAVENPDVTVSLTGSCGETMRISLKVEEGVIRSASYFTDGCGPISACGAMATKLAINKTLDEAMETIDHETVAQAVGGLPEDKIHCAKLASETSQEAIHRYMLSRRWT
ncbi:MAG: iron-sulfur cluster assembly scaffold protein [Deltaproteobacteria bacterium CG17_big_fil_post_rev_8_21_14_2_50_51_6]|nr:MAG: iron-sulfur cluster assembly scaffold protein [Deltaproteobacteria bacterium CG17_big_fil_post_rev_8_21_14_2_50_51_6]